MKKKKEILSEPTSNGIKRIVSGRENSPLINQLVNLNEAKYTGNQLYFDPEDGQLKVVKKEKQKPSADAMVIDQIAEDGFMANFTLR